MPLSKPQLRPSLALLLTLMLLSGCLSGTDSTSSAGDRPNSFPPLNQAFSETGSGDFSACRNLQPNEICVTVEVPRALAGNAAQPSRRNLFLVEPTRVEVFRVGEGLQPMDSLSVSVSQDEQGSLRLQLDDFQAVPADPDYVIQAILPGGVRVRGPLSDTDQDVKLNPFSEYLVAVTLNGLGADAIAAIKECDASNNICLNQLVWPTLVDQIQDFEISIPDGLGLEAAVAYLDGRPDLTEYVDAMVSTLQVSDSRSGEIQGSAVAFNTVYFGLELNRRSRADGTVAGQWGLRRMTTGINTANAGDAETYPNLTLTTFDVLGLSVNSLASNAPYRRETLLQTAQDAFEQMDWLANQHATAPGSALIRDGRFLQGGRSVLQSVTAENGMLWGWAPNPYFLNGYLYADDNGAPEALASSYFHTGKALALSRAADGTYEREGTLEDASIATFEINLKQLDATAKDEPLDLNEFGTDYNAVSFSLSLSEVNAYPVEARVQAGDWVNTSAGSAIATFDEANVSGSRLARSDTGLVVGPLDEATPRQITLQNEIDEIYLDSANPKTSAYYGRIAVNDGGSQSGIGAAIASGDLLAYTFADGERGQGLRIVAAETAFANIDGRYLIQGFALGMSDHTNDLLQLNGSELTIVGASSASLALSTLQVSHRLEDGMVADPERNPTQSLTGAVTEHVGDNLTISLGNGALRLRGFATAGGDMLVLTLDDNDSVGLVLGFRDI